MIRNPRSATMALALAALTVGVALPVTVSHAQSSGGQRALSEARGHADYQQGKAVVRDELGEMPSNPEEAREILQGLKSGELGADLSEEDRQAARTYLEKRWDLN